MDIFGISVPTGEIICRGSLVVFISMLQSTCSAICAGWYPLFPMWVLSNISSRFYSAVINNVSRIAIYGLAPNLLEFFSMATYFAKKLVCVRIRELWGLF